MARAGEWTCLQDISNNGRRANVEVIDWNGSLAVKKTFRKGYERFLERERLAMKTFSRLRPEIPPLLEGGPDYVIFPYYEDVLKFDKRALRLLPLAVVEQAIDVLPFLYEQGYALLDFTPHNIVVDRLSGLKVIDFEFLHRYETKPETFEASYDLAGIPADFAGDRPVDSVVTYRRKWEPYTGLDIGALLYQPRWRKRLFRLRYLLINRSTSVLSDRARRVGKRAKRLLV